VRLQALHDFAREHAHGLWNTHSARGAVTRG
jgi:hypothetical protein